MAPPLRNVTLALVGSGVLAQLHVGLALNGANGPWKGISVKTALVSITGSWVALASALVFALAPQTGERDVVASMSINASALTATSALLGTILEFAVSELYVTEKFEDSVNASFKFLRMTTAMALMWRAWRGE